MKKIIVAIVLLALLVLPYVFGSKTESSIQAFVDRMEQEKSIDVESFEYERGWFSSTYKGVIWSKPNSYRLETSGKVYHGPIAFGALSSGVSPIGLGVIESNAKVSMSPLFKRDDLIEFMSEPLRSVSNLSFGQTVSGELNYEANDIVKDETTFSLMPAEVEYSYNLKSDDLSIKGGIDGFNIIDKNCDCRFGPIKVDIAGFRRENYSYMLGGGDITMDSMHLTFAGTGEQGDTKIIVDSIFGNGDSDIEAGMLVGDAKYGYKSMEITNSDGDVILFDYGVFDMAVGGIDAEAMEAYMDTLKSIEDFEDPKVAEMFIASMKKLFTEGNPAMKITLSNKSVTDLNLSTRSAAENDKYNIAIADLSLQFDTKYRDGLFSTDHTFDLGKLNFKTEDVAVNLDSHSSKFSLQFMLSKILEQIEIGNVDPESLEMQTAALDNLGVDLVFNNKAFVLNMPGLSVDTGELELAGEINVVEGLLNGKTKVAVEKIDYQQGDNPAYSVGKSFYEQTDESYDLLGLLKIGGLTQNNGLSTNKALVDQMAIEMLARNQPKTTIGMDVNLNDDFLRINAIATLNPEIAKEAVVIEQLALAADAEADIHVTEGMLNTIATIITSIQIKPQAKQFGLSEQETADMIAQQSAGQVQLVKSIGVLEPAEDGSLKSNLAFKAAQFLVNGQPFGR